MQHAPHRLLCSARPGALTALQEELPVPTSTNAGARGQKLLLLAAVEQVHCPWKTYET